MFRELVHKRTRCRGRPSTRSNGRSRIKGGWSRICGWLGSSGYSCLADVPRCSGSSFGETDGGGGKIASGKLKRAGSASDCVCKERHDDSMQSKAKKRIDGKASLKKLKTRHGHEDKLLNETMFDGRANTSQSSVANYFGRLCVMEGKNALPSSNANSPQSHENPILGSEAHTRNSNQTVIQTMHCVAVPARYNKATDSSLLCPAPSSLPVRSAFLFLSWQNPRGS